jgi:hypothetical protein
MREWIGYLVARRGAEQAVVRTAVGIPQRYLCGEERAYRADASMDASIGALDGFDVSESISAAPTDSARTGTPITIIYAREKSADDAIEEIAGALAGFAVFD